MKTLFSLLILFGAFALVAALSSCEGGGIGTNLEDGYQVGDITRGTIEDVNRYCSEEYRQARAAGRFAAGLSGVQIPDICKELWTIYYQQDQVE